MELSIVLPAYEEAENLRHLLPLLHGAAQALTSHYEIIIVDTETPQDDTPHICAENQVCYVPRRGGSFFGDAIRTGLQTARGRYVILMDADGSHEPEFIAQLWPYRDDFDVVIASRYVPGGETDNPYILILMSLIVNCVFRLVLNLNCHDVSNSFRLYQGDQVRALQLSCRNFDVVEEILIKLDVGGRALRIKEVPFTFRKRFAGKTKRKLLPFAIGYLATLYKLYRIKRDLRGTSSTLRK